MIEAMVIKYNGSFYQLLSTGDGSNGCNKCCFSPPDCPSIGHEGEEKELCIAMGCEGYLKEVV